PDRPLLLHELEQAQHGRVRDLLLPLRPEPVADLAHRRRPMLPEDLEDRVLAATQRERTLAGHDGASYGPEVLIDGYYGHEMGVRQASGRLATGISRLDRNIS